MRRFFSSNYLFLNLDHICTLSNLRTWQNIVSPHFQKTFFFYWICISSLFFESQRSRALWHRSLMYGSRNSSRRREKGQRSWVKGDELYSTTNKYSFLVLRSKAGCGKGRYFLSKSNWSVCVCVYTILLWIENKKEKIANIIWISDWAKEFVCMRKIHS